MTTKTVSAGAAGPADLTTPADPGLTGPKLPAERGRGPLPAAGEPPDRRLRLWVCAGTIAAALPYLALKIAWLSGAHPGVRGDGMASGAMVGANAATLAMDAFAALVALALVRPWGRRLPAALLVFPVWVATGFLGPVLVAAPLSAVVGSLGGAGSGTAAQHAPDDIAGWVFAVVYTGFGLQGIGLLLGFVLYARVRWAAVFRLRMRDLPRGAAFATHRTVASGVALFSLLPAGVHLYWAAGGTALRPGDDRTWPVRLVVEGTFGLVPVAGAAAMLALAWRRDARPARATLTAAWLGTGTMFAWGFWWMLTASVSTPLTDGADLRGLGLVGGTGMLGGAVLATVLAVLVGGLAGGPAGGPADAGDGAR